MLQAQIVLIRVRRPKMRIHEEQKPAVVERQKARGSKIKIRCGQLRGKRIWSPRGAKRIVEILDDGILCRRNSGERDASVAEKGRLPVELQIVFALQHVVENTETASDAGLAVALWIPREAEARSPIVLVGEI